MALAGVSMASVSRRSWRSALQRDSYQPLLGADVCILSQQVNPASVSAAGTIHCYLLNLPLFLCCRFGSNPSIYVVQVGASEQTLKPEQVVVHRKFKGQSGGHDLAMLKLPSAKGHCVTFEPNTNAACLPAEDSAAGAKTASSCVVMVATSWTGP
ncbi:hypothetical protein XENOCAPTIV_000781, partial [Xenoophorus captivus]